MQPILKIAWEKMSHHSNGFNYWKGLSMREAFHFPLFKSLRIKIVKYRPVCQDCRQKVWVEMAISKAKSCVTFASPYFH